MRARAAAPPSAAGRAESGRAEPRRQRHGRHEAKVNNACKPEVKVAQQSNTGKSGRLEENGCPAGQLLSVKHGGE